MEWYCYRSVVYTSGPMGSKLCGYCCTLSCWRPTIFHASFLFSSRAKQLKNLQHPTHLDAQSLPVLTLEPTEGTTLSSGSYITTEHSGEVGASSWEGTTEEEQVSNTLGSMSDLEDSKWDLGHLKKMHFMVKFHENHIKSIKSQDTNFC